MIHGCIDCSTRRLFVIVDHGLPFLVASVTVTRLIRISYGDYTLQTIPPGIAIPVPYKPVKQQKARGPLLQKPAQQRKGKSFGESDAAYVRWIRGDH